MASLLCLSGSGKDPGSDQNHKHITERQQDSHVQVGALSLCWTPQFVLEASLSADQAPDALPEPPLLTLILPHPPDSASKVYKIWMSSL